MPIRNKVAGQPRGIADRADNCLLLTKPITPLRPASTRTQLLLKIEQGLLAHADKALSRPLEIDDNPKHHLDCQRHNADCEGLPDSIKDFAGATFL